MLPQQPDDTLCALAPIAVDTEAEHLLAAIPSGALFSALLALNGEEAVRRVGFVCKEFWESEEVVSFVAVDTDLVLAGRLSELAFGGDRAVPEIVTLLFRSERIYRHIFGGRQRHARAISGARTP